MLEESGPIPQGGAVSDTQPPYAALVERTFKTSVRANNPAILVLGGLAVFFGTALTLGLLSGPLAVGLAAASLKMARGQSADLDDLKEGFRHLVPALVAGIGVVILMSLGLLLLVVPAIILAFIFTYTFTILADRPDTSGVDAMRESLDMAKRAPGPTVVFWVVALAITFLLSFIPGIGTAVGVGLSALLNAQFYQTLRERQQIARAA